MSAPYQRLSQESRVRSADVPMPGQYSSDVLGRIREVVASLGTQKDAAEKTGIPYATLQRILAGKSEVGFRRLVLIAEAAGISVEQLLTGIAEQAAPAIAAQSCPDLSRLITTAEAFAVAIDSLWIPGSVRRRLQVRLEDHMAAILALEVRP